MESDSGDGLFFASSPFKMFSHGPENAENELRKAFHQTVECEVTHVWDRGPIPEVDPGEVRALYRQAFDAWCSGKLLYSERLARACKHLGRALCHEARLHYWIPRNETLPSLEGGQAATDLAEALDDTLQHLHCLAERLTPDLEPYFQRAQRHLTELRAQGSPPLPDLVRSSRIQAAHEYARTVECLLLALELHPWSPVALTLAPKAA